MSNEEYTLKRIAELLESGKYKKTHDMIVYLFQIWLEKMGIPREKMIIRDNINIKFRDEEETLEVDLAIKKNNELPILFEIIEPDPNWSLENPDILKRVELMLIKVFAYLLKPKRIFLTDGKLFLVYDEKGSLIERLNLMTIDSKKEEELRNLIKSCLG